MALPIYGCTSHRCQIGKRGWKCHIHFLKSHGLEVTHLSAHIPWVRIRTSAWVQEELGSVSPGQATTLATTLHEGEVIVGRLLTRLLQADLLTSLLLRNILAFPDLLASHFPVGTAPYTRPHISL